VRKEARISRIEALNRDFDHSVSQALDLLTASAARLTQTAGGMSGNSLVAGRQTAAVVSASNRASANVLTVAAAREQVSASIQEISRQIAQSTVVAGQAVGGRQARPTPP